MLSTACKGLRAPETHRAPGDRGFFARSGCRCRRREGLGFFFLLLVLFFFFRPVSPLKPAVPAPPARIRPAGCPPPRGGHRGDRGRWAERTDPPPWQASAPRGNHPLSPFPLPRQQTLRPSVRPSIPQPWPGQRGALRGAADSRDRFAEPLAPRFPAARSCRNGGYGGVPPAYHPRTPTATLKRWGVTSAPLLWGGFGDPRPRAAGAPLSPPGGGCVRFCRHTAAKFQVTPLFFLFIFLFCWFFSPPFPSPEPSLSAFPKIVSRYNPAARGEGGGGMVPASKTFTNNR